MQRALIHRVWADGVSTFFCAAGAPRDAPVVLLLEGFPTSFSISRVKATTRRSVARDCAPSPWLWFHLHSRKARLQYTLTPWQKKWWPSPTRFRVWNEGHDVGQEAPSNPHHVLEIHPVWGLQSGSLKIPPRGSRVFPMPTYAGYGASKFRPLLTGLMQQK